jgi:hypothetical protein
MNGFPGKIFLKQRLVLAVNIIIKFLMTIPALAGEISEIDRYPMKTADHMLFLPFNPGP